ncbi:hypothetical protein [Rhodococcus opacus]|uniref:hypothetical protein n=1 Tax=Rhodococcus opacus TaxID=37919 RepID=UPI0034D1D096
MASAQLLARGPLAAEGDLELVETDPRQPVNSLSSVEQTAPGRAIVLGTETLLRLAAALRELDFVVTSLELTDSRFRRDPAGFEDIEERALDLLRNDSIDDVLDFFRNVARGYYVVTIELRARNGGGRFTVRRNGWITIHNSSTTARVKFALHSLSKQVGIV